nr:MAG TPA: hypothetical protein [Caudoviricetes sp.]
MILPFAFVILSDEVRPHFKINRRAARRRPEK